MRPQTVCQLVPSFLLYSSEVQIYTLLLVITFVYSSLLSLFGFKN